MNALQELEHDGPMRVEQPEHAEDEDGEPWQRAREESGGSAGWAARTRTAAAGWVARTTRTYAQQAARLRCGKFACMRAVLPGVRTAQACLGYGEDVWLLGVAGSGGDDAVRLAGCEGSVSLAWRTGEG